MMSPAQTVIHVNCMNGREMSSQTSAKQTRRKQTNSQKQPLNKRMVESADSHSPPNPATK